MKTTFYRSKCGNKIMTLLSGEEKLCEDSPFEIIVPNSVEASFEKHIPVVKIENKMVYVTVSSVTHPMTENHYIQFITVRTTNGIYTKTLNYTDKPEMNLILNENEKVIEVYAYCNLHGLWKAE